MEKRIIECKELPKGFKLKIGDNVYVGTGPDITPDNDPNALSVAGTTIQ